MIHNNLQDVSTAFEALLEEIEAEVDFVNTVGSRSFEGRDYARAKEALARAGILIAFRDKVSALRAEWQTIAAVAEQEEDDETKAERRNLGRLRNGQRTPEAAYREPILRVIQSMGGSGNSADVLEKVGQIMKPKLRPVDFEPLASGPNNPRWRNAAQWARNTMVKEGLLKSDSPRGVWQISPAGVNTFSTHPK
jgi:restriction system protein